MRTYPAAVLLAIACVACGDAGCGNTVVTRAASPSHQLEAVVFDRDCGATTGYSRQVSVVDSGQAPRGIGNVFVAAHRIPVAVRWRTPDSLEVSYASEEKPLKMSQTRGAVILFQPLARLQDEASGPRLSNDR